MTQTQFEIQAIKKAYNQGEISYEDYTKLMNDITIIWWKEF